MNDIPASDSPAADLSSTDASVGEQLLLSDDYLARFGGIARLYGIDALTRLAQAHFAVIGLGGVGSWAAEALARSGVGRLTLIEMDDVCVTNTNRQIHALQSTVGKEKQAVMTTRLQDINPELRINRHDSFITRNNMRELIDHRYHVVIDAMDAVHIKAALVAYCSAIKIRLITIGSSGGKLDPTAIQVKDLGHTTSDPILAKIRHQLFKHHHFSRDAHRKFKIDAVFSTEQMVYPKPDGSVCQEKTVLQNGTKLDCAGGFGSSTMVTGSFGFVAAHRAIERYLQNNSR